MIRDEVIRNKWDSFVFSKNHKETNEKEYIKCRNDLIEIYYPLVFKVANKLHTKIREVDIDDLVGWGTDGLFQAIERFDLSLNIKFETYAIYRIRGSIIDNIRQIDWVPRLVRQRQAKIQKAKQSLESSLGRIPTFEEISKELGISLEEYAQMESKSNLVSCISLNSGKSEQHEYGEQIQVETVVSDEDKPSCQVLREEMFKKLMGRNFIPLERKIIHMHYYNNMTMKEIAEKTGYSESRISQMHSKIIERLKKKVELNPTYMKDLQAILHS